MKQSKYKQIILLQDLYSSFNLALKGVQAGHQLAENRTKINFPFLTYSIPTSLPSAFTKLLPKNSKLLFSILFITFLIFN